MSTNFFATSAISNIPLLITNCRFPDRLEFRCFSAEIKEKELVLGALGSTSIWGNICLFYTKFTLGACRSTEEGANVRFELSCFSADSLLCFGVQVSFIVFFFSRFSVA